MLTTLAIVLLVLWALGLVSAFTMGGFIHVLLVAAVVSLLLRIILVPPPDWHRQTVARH